MNFNFPNEQSHKDFIEVRDYLLNLSNISYKDLTGSKKEYHDESVFKYILSMLRVNKEEILTKFKPKTYEIF